MFNGKHVVVGRLEMERVWDVFEMSCGWEIDVHKAKQVGISGMGECKLVKEFI